MPSRRPEGSTRAFGVPPPTSDPYAEVEAKAEAVVLPPSRLLPTPKVAKAKLTEPIGNRLIPGATGPVPSFDRLASGKPAPPKPPPPRPSVRAPYSGASSDPAPSAQSKTIVSKARPIVSSSGASGSKDPAPKPVAVKARPVPPKGPPPTKRSYEEAEVEEAEESLASVDPDLRVDLSGTGVEIIDPNTYRLVGLTRQSISKFHDIISCDFHNCLDLDRRGTHVNWSDDYPVSPFEAQRFLTNGLVIVCSYCYKQETKQHIIRTTCNTAESLESELGAIAWHSWF